MQEVLKGQLPSSVRGLRGQGVELFGRSEALVPFLDHQLVWLKYCVASSGLSMIVAEQPTKALPPHHLTAVAPKVWLRDDELVGKTLMIAFVMIMD